MAVQYMHGKYKQTIKINHQKNKKNWKLLQTMTKQHQIFLNDDNWQYW